MNQTYSDQDIKSYFERAFQLQQNNQLNDAESIYRKILEINASHLGAQTMLGIIYVHSNRDQEGIKLLQSSLLKDSKQYWAHNALGIGLLNTSQYEKACLSFEDAISVRSDFIEAYFNLAKAQKSLEKYEDAVISYSKCISLNSNYADAYNNRGTIYLQNLKDLEKALSDFKNFLKIQPNSWNSFYNIANCYSELKEYEEALKNYDQAIELNPNNPDIYLSCGVTYYKLEQHEDALKSYGHALELDPSNADVYFSRGVTYYELGKYEEALKNYDQAIELKSDEVHAYTNRAIVNVELKFYKDAFKDFDCAINIKPDFFETYSSRGVLFTKLKQHEKALKDFNHAIELKPDIGNAYFNKAILKFLEGHFEEGLELFEWRWKTTFLNLQPRDFKQPLWLGQESLTNKIILIHHEQGLGDSIQFSRYIPLLDKYHPKKILLEAPQVLISCLSTLRGNFKIVRLGDPLPHFDCYCPIMSLPLAFKTTLENIPSEMPYLYADKNKISLWETKLGTKINPRVGLVWSGFKGHKNDRNRSLLLNQLKPIFDLPFEFHALQKEIREIDLEVLNNESKIRQHQNELIDFSDTAALIEHLDLVVSVDTSVAHLAGALGKKVFLMLPYAPDYRWMDERLDSPWYPTMRLFRQPQEDDWNSVVSEICHEMSNFLKRQ
jgi:tetratricopeptide (TPR) repeat protein